VSRRKPFATACSPLNRMEPLATKASVLRTYEEIAEDVEERRQTPWTDVIDFEKTLPRGRTVLELGCGSGRNAVHFALAGHKVIAIDFARGMLGRAAIRAKDNSVAGSVHPIQADVTAPPIKDSSVDVCLYVAALHHLPTRQERIRSLEEARRCLRPGGKALVSVWAFEQRRFQRILERHKGKKEGFGDVLIPMRSKDGRAIRRFYHLFVGGELEQLIHDAGLEIEQHFKSHDNYFVVTVRPHRDR
jgi:tRNA (uracil-5-)-methyltransferase TRM9